MIDDDHRGMFDELPRARAPHSKPALTEKNPAIRRKAHKRRANWNDIGITILFSLIAIAILVFGVHVLGVPR